MFRKFEHLIKKEHCSLQRKASSEPEAATDPSLLPTHCRTTERIFQIQETTRHRSPMTFAIAFDF